jgi:hypothetical protein
MKIQTSKHKYAGATADLFFDVVITATAISLHPWRVHITETPEITTVTATDWENRVAAYPAINALATGAILGAVNQTLVYRLESASTIRLDDTVRPLGSGEWADHSNWFFLQNEQGYLLEPMSVFADTFISRCKTMRYLEKGQTGCVMQLVVSFSSKKISDCSVSVVYNSAHGMASNFVFVDADFTEVTERKYNGNFFPWLKLTGPASISAGSTETLAVTLTDKQGNVLDEEVAEVYLDAVSGYLPKTRVTTVKGVALFKVSAFGLDVGDQLRVKCGFRNFSGVADIVMEVV